ncbi:MAG: tyrosine-type recombinase/integrase [Solirubrobacteraceae bacterium]|nr:tyrosine-type recombinase/integrase [Solirubrobacteraceae bacterium]
MHERPPRVSGSVFVVERQRGDQWYAKWRVGREQFKRRLGPVWSGRGRPVDGYLTRRMAEAQLQSILTDERRGEGAHAARRQASARNVVTLADAAKAWLHHVEFEKDRAPTTVGDYTRIAENHITKHFGASTPIDTITDDDVGSLRVKLLSSDRLTRASAHKVMVFTNGLFRYAKRRKWIAVNPCEDVERIGLRKSGEFAVLTPEEVHAVMAKAKSPQDTAVYAVAAFAGLRMGELRALRWRDVDFANGTLHVRASYTHTRLRTPKSGKVRSVPLIDQAAKALDALSRRERLTDPEDLVFISPTGGYLHDGDMRRRFYTALTLAELGHKRTGDKPMTFHDLRHTFGTLAVQVWPLSDVQAYMGHSDVTTTMIYVHHVPKRDAADALSALVASAQVRTYAPAAEPGPAPP